MITSSHLQSCLNITCTRLVTKETKIQVLPPFQFPKPQGEYNLYCHTKLGHNHNNQHYETFCGCPPNIRHQIVKDEHFWTSIIAVGTLAPIPVMKGCVGLDNGSACTRTLVKFEVRPHVGT